MPILDFLKKSQKDKKIRLKARKISKSSKKNIVKNKLAKEQGRKKKAGKSVKLKESKFAWRVLIAPRVTERSTELTSINQYTFQVTDHATKLDIKRAINEIYGVNVKSVRKIKVARKKKGKPTRRAKQTGWSPGYTKALVELKEGEKIEVLPH